MATVTVSGSDLLLTLSLLFFIIEFIGLGIHAVLATARIDKVPVPPLFDRDVFSSSRRASPSFLQVMTDLKIIFQGNSATGTRLAWHGGKLYSQSINLHIASCTR